MTNPLHAGHYADRACVEEVSVVENVALARDTFRVRVRAPQIAARIVPGQFVMLRLDGSDDPLLGRPLALYDTYFDDAASSSGATGTPSGLDIVYLVVGKLTSRLARLGPGAKLRLWGPLGNGFAPAPAEHLLMVAGGIGQTPMLALAREYGQHRHYGSPPRVVPTVGKITLCYGARTKDYLAGVDDFRRLGVDVRISTDDGSAGHHGLVTDLVAEALSDGQPARVVCCGPERMMEAVAHLCQQRGVRCEVSLETPMACGIGICFSCVTRVRENTPAAEAGAADWDYRRTCVEGPVFDAAQIVW